jgi:hypothetical protein
MEGFITILIISGVIWFLLNQPITTISDERDEIKEYEQFKKNKNGN